MKSKIKLIISLLCYVLSFFALGYYFYLLINPKFSLSELSSITILCTSCFFHYFASLSMSKSKTNPKYMRYNLYYSFALFLTLIISLAILDPSRGLSLSFFTNHDLFKQYMSTHINFIPFATITTFIKNLLASKITTNIFLYNILGNIICLMPLGLFLPLISSKEKKLKYFIPTTIIFILSIELIQFITLSGTIDIDDIILNFLGAFISFLIFKIPSIIKLIENIFLLSNHKLTKKDYLTYLITFIIILILFTLTSIFYKHFKSQEFQATKIELVDESTSCNNTPELFYEDENYKYYFNCEKSNYVYVIFNDKDKYLLKDFLNKKVTTNYELDTHYLTNSNIGIKLESKKTEINIKYEGEYIMFEANILNPEIINLENTLNIWGKSYGEATYRITPLKEGTTKVIFEVRAPVNFPEYGTIDTLEYLITVNKDLSVTYEQIK